MLTDEQERGTDDARRRIGARGGEIGYQLYPAPCREYISKEQYCRADEYIIGDGDQRLAREISRFFVIIGEKRHRSHDRRGNESQNEQRKISPEQLVPFLHFFEFPSLYYYMRARRAQGRGAH